MRNITIIFFTAIALTSCISTPKQDPYISEKHGGTLKINEQAFSWNFNPHTIDNQSEKNIARQIYDGLLKYNPRNLTLAPSIAKYWIFSEGGKKYTFYLRTNAWFHKNECFMNAEKTRKITAQDFKYSFEKLCTYSESQTVLPQVMEVIVGGKKYFNATKNVKPKKGIIGIEVVNDSTLNVLIEAPNSLFINLFAEINMVVIPKEAIEMYGEESYVGSGPFFIPEKPVNSKKLILKRNENYFFADSKGNSLPYFDQIEVSFEDSKEKQIEMFVNKQLDIVFDLPSEIIPPFLEKYKEAFKGEKPLYIVSKDKAGGLEPSYILQHSYLKSFASNRHNFIDYTRVYFEKNN